MKVLYAVQATGNGHLSRCIEFYPLLCQYAEVDLMLSGIQGDLTIDFPIKYKFHGLSFIFGRTGGIDYVRTALKLKPLRLLKDIYRLDVSEYDLVISDFEPISAWAARRAGVPSVALSHQAAFLSELTPRPAQRSAIVEKLYRWFAPTDRAVGLHYDSYDEFIETPVIREKIRNIKRAYTTRDVLVYLPAYGDELMIDRFESIAEYQWHIFSKHTDRAYSVGDHIHVYPVGVPEWTEMLSRCSMAIIGGGFQGPAEMIHLGKKLMVIPMYDQYEQLCNAAALSDMGVTVVRDVGDDRFPEQLTHWLSSAEPVDISFPDRSDAIVRRVLDKKN